VSGKPTRPSVSADRKNPHSNLAFVKISGATDWPAVEAIWGLPLSPDENI
jgi:hypothetical protein